jgi:hypothetical protein
MSLSRFADALIEGFPERRAPSDSGYSRINLLEFWVLKNGL